ncbi:MAG: NAD(P)H-dependent oxidoreductase [Sphingorhabdus sp.]
MAQGWRWQAKRVSFLCMKQLLIVWHSLTGGSEALARAALDGANGKDDVATRLLHADVAQTEDMCAADGYVFVFPENLAAIAGVMKAFFDRCYYPCLGAIEGRPYAIIVCAGSDGSNAVRQAERIATGWRLKKVADSMIICTHAQTPEAILAPKVIGDEDLGAAHDLGASLAAGLAMGIF